MGKVAELQICKPRAPQFRFRYSTELNSTSYVASGAELLCHGISSSPSHRFWHRLEKATIGEFDSGLPERMASGANQMACDLSMSSEGDETIEGATGRGETQKAVIVWSTSWTPAGADLTQPMDDASEIKRCERGQRKKSDRAASTRKFMSNPVLTSFIAVRATPLAVFTKRTG